MEFTFDVEFFANLIAEKLRQGYPLRYAIMLAMAQYPPLINAILKGIEKGGI